MRTLVIVVALAGAAGCDDKKKDFESYANAQKATEARLHLNRLAKLMKTYVIATGAYPNAKAPLTPATPCCEQPGQTCAPDPAAWRAEPWQTLEMTIDEPHRFQYGFEADGATFTARAVGDPACNGKTVTFTIRGKLESEGIPTVDLSEITSTKK